MTTISDIPFTRTDGGTGTLADHAGEVVLVVNVASQCGLTPQYEALQQLHADKHADGLTILGFPANDFGAQEPGNAEEIASFCKLTYDVTFPVLKKVDVNGAAASPLYDWMKREAPGLMAATALVHDNRPAHAIAIALTIDVADVGYPCAIGAALRGIDALLNSLARVAGVVIAIPIVIAVAVIRSAVRTVIAAIAADRAGDSGDAADHQRTGDDIARVDAVVVTVARRGGGCRQSHRASRDGSDEGF